MKGKSGEVFESGDGMGVIMQYVLGYVVLDVGRVNLNVFLLTGVFMFFTVRFV